MLCSRESPKGFGRSTGPSVSRTTKQTKDDDNRLAVQPDNRLQHLGQRGALLTHKVAVQRMTSGAPVGRPRSGKRTEMNHPGKAW